MSEERNLYAAAGTHAIMREELLREFPELATDDVALADSLEGVSSFAESVRLVLRSIDEDQILIDGIKARITELLERNNRHADRIDRKRAAITQAMERAGEKRLTLPEATLSLSPAQPKLIVTEEMLIPPLYLVQPPAKLDKRALLADLKSGTTVPGAEMSNPGALQLTIRRK